VVICAALAAAQPTAKKIAGPPQPRAEGIVRLFDLIGTEVRKFSALDVVPNGFGRIQVGRISGRPWEVAFCEQSRGLFASAFEGLQVASHALRHHDPL
jgi:hypothetical protein